jgi:AcrR family transcriptional regulator
MKIRKKTPDAHHHGNLREAVLAAAMSLLRQRQTPSFNLREIAKMTGVGHSAVYRHFASKDALLADIAARGFVELAQIQGREMDLAGDDPWERLIAAGLVYVNFARTYRAAYIVMFDPTMREHWTELENVRTALDTSFGQFAKTIVACQTAGLLPAAPLEIMTSILWSAGHGLAQLLGSGHLDWLQSSATGEDQFVSIAIHVFCEALRAPASRPWLELRPGLAAATRSPRSKNSS